MVGPGGERTNERLDQAVAELEALKRDLAFKVRRVGGLTDGDRQFAASILAGVERFLAAIIKDEPDAVLDLATRNRLELVRQSLDALVMEAAQTVERATGENE